MNFEWFDFKRFDFEWLDFEWLDLEWFDIDLFQMSLKSAITPLCIGEKSTFYMKCGFASLQWNSVLETLSPFWSILSYYQRILWKILRPYWRSSLTMLMVFQEDHLVKKAEETKTMKREMGGHLELPFGEDIDTF